MERLGLENYEGCATMVKENFKLNAAVVSPELIRAIIDSFSEQVDEEVAGVDNIDVELIAYATHTVYTCCARLIELDDKLRKDIGEVFAKYMPLQLGDKVPNNTDITMEALFRQKSHFTYTEQVIMAVNYELSAHTDYTDPVSMLNFYVDVCEKLNELGVIRE